MCIAMLNFSPWGAIGFGICVWLAGLAGAILALYLLVISTPSFDGQRLFKLLNMCLKLIMPILVNIAVAIFLAGVAISQCKDMYGGFVWASFADAAFMFVVILFKCDRKYVG